MDPPDILGVDLSTARPTQLLGRAKSEWLFSFLLPVSCAKPPSPYPAARVMSWALSFLSLCWHLLFADPGGSWGDGVCCHLAIHHCQQCGRLVALPDWTLPCCPSSESLVPS